MKCKKCNTETSGKEYLCPNCGEYVKIPPCANLFIVSIVLLLISMIFSKTFLILLLLPAILLMVIGVIMSIVDMIKSELIKKSSSIPNSINTYFIKNDSVKPRQKDGDIQKGDVLLCFGDETFKIVQADETIENKIASIYYLDVWEYNGETYYKFVMRSHNEYMLKNTNGEIDIIINCLSDYGIKIEDNR